MATETATDSARELLRRLRADYVQARIWKAIDYEPYPKQRAAHLSPARFKSIQGAPRAGKSIWAAHEILPDTFVPGWTTWLVGPSYELATKEYEYLLEALAAIHGPHVLKGFAQSFRGLGGPGGMLPWGHRILCKSAEKAQSLLGDDVHTLVICEAPQIKRRIWEHRLQARLRRVRGRVVAAYSPEPGDWLLDAFENRAEQKHADFYHDRFTAFDNPTFEKEEAEQARALLSDAAWRHTFYGDRTHLEGVIYADFDPVLNGGNFGWDENAETCVEIDFGLSFASIHWFNVKRDAQGRECKYVFDELTTPNLTTEGIINAIKIHTTFKRGTIAAVYPDPAGFGRATQTGLSDASLLRQHLKCHVWHPSRPTDRDVERGIGHVRNLVKAADGTRRLFVGDRCPRLRLAMQNYRYKENGIDPLKDGVHDHPCDALRYGIVGRFAERAKFGAVELVR